MSQSKGRRQRGAPLARVGVGAEMGAGYMRRRRGNVLLNLLVAFATGDVVEQLCDRLGHGSLLFRLTTQILFY